MVTLRSVSLWLLAAQVAPMTVMVSVTVPEMGQGPRLADSVIQDSD
jgi:hypothetical protein